MAEAPRTPYPPFWTFVRVLPLLVFAAGVTVSFLLSQNARLAQEKEAQDRFEFHFHDIINNIQERLRGYEQVLRGTAGLFPASDTVTRPEFHEYVTSLQLQDRYPGIQGVGFAQIIDPARKAQHIAAIRREGFPDYTLRPAGERDFYTSIVYLEPFDWRNQRAFGYDMFSEPVRRAAMERARDTGAAAISGKVTLVQETDQDVQSGFLMYVPIYRKGAPHDTVTERRAAIVGWAYAPFRTKDLMRGVLGNQFLAAGDRPLQLEIYDGERAEPESALYLSSRECPADTERAFHERQKMEIAGRLWTVSVCSPSPPASLLAGERARLILTAGISGSILLALIIWLLGTGRARALGLATRMTRAMRVLSDCNMALVHAASEESLLKEICRLLVVTGGYRLAWIGYADQDPDKTIRPVAKAGLDEGYVDSIRATWDKTERGLGPTGTAVREGRVVINQDFAATPWMTPWRSPAEARGFHSSIALPFTANESVHGVLTIYSSVTAAFSPREVELLQELANDLAFGIETLRIRIKRETAEKELEFLAHHDPLTRLPNRLLLEERFRAAAQSARGKPQGLALLFLDMDNFKQVNDTFGHQIGDALLVRVTERLRRCLRAGDTLSRQGGDEFVILQPGIGGPAEVEATCKRIMESFGEPFEVEGYPIHSSFSIGVSFFERDGTEFQVLLKKADAALYNAKDSGRNTFLFFNEKMNVDAREEIQLRGDLRNALKNGELLLHYQPQFDLARGAVVGAEALLRWRHPERGMIPPATFIPIAEKSGLIIPLGDWVLREACRQMRQWNDAGLPPMTVAVNVSAAQLRGGDLLDAVSEALEQAGLPGHQLELELTESMLLKDIDATVALFHVWKMMGVKISIDDFGTGYSSLAYLTRLSVDKLKVDQSFVRGLKDDPEDAAVVRAIIHLGHTLGLATIAEGVETAGQLAFLRENGCDEAQGYLFSRPVPPDEFVAFVRSYASRDALRENDVA